MVGEFGVSLLGTPLSAVEQRSVEHLYGESAHTREAALARAEASYQVSLPGEELRGGVGLKTNCLAVILFSIRTVSLLHSPVRGSDTNNLEVLFWLYRCKG